MSLETIKEIMETYLSKSLENIKKIKVKIVIERVFILIRRKFRWKIRIKEE